MRSSGIVRWLALVGLGLLIYVPASSGATKIANGHVDIGVEGNPSGLELHWHVGDPDTEFAPDDAYLFVDPQYTKLAKPTGSQWNFLGATGDFIYVLSDSPSFPPTGATISNTPFVGWAAEEVTGNFDGGILNLVLTGFSFSGSPGTSGHFSVFRQPAFGPLQVLIATSDGIDGASDRIVLAVGAHVHYYIVLTEVGLYELTFVAEGRVNGNLVRSEAGVFRFGVGTEYSPGVIPEPASLAMTSLAFLSVGGLAVVRRRTGRGRNEA